MASAYPLAGVVSEHFSEDAAERGATAAENPEGSLPLPFEPNAGEPTGRDGFDPLTGDGTSSRTPATASPPATGSALIDQVLGSARLLGHDLSVPDLPLAKLSPENPLRHALLAWTAATGSQVPADELTRELARADALPIDLQRDLAILVLSASEATLLQKQALAALSPEDIAFIHDNPELGDALAKGVSNPDTLRLAALAGKVDTAKSLQATLLLLEAVEVTRGRLSTYEVQEAQRTLDTLGVDPTTRALLDKLSTGAAVTSDADKIRFAADLIALTSGFELDRTPLVSVSFADGLQALLGATSQPADLDALRVTLDRANALPNDLNRALGTLLLAQAGAIAAANPATATPEGQAQAMVDVLDAAAAAAPVLQKYHYYWTGAAEALRVAQWEPELRLQWAAQHGGLLVSAGSSPAMAARAAGLLAGADYVEPTLPKLTFAQALDALARSQGMTPKAESTLLAAEAAEQLAPSVRDAATILMTGAAEAARLDREAFASMSRDDRVFLEQTTELVAALYFKESLSQEELDILARHTMLAAKVDVTKLAAAGVIATTAMEDASRLLEGAGAYSTQSSVALQPTGWRAWLAKLLPWGSARAQTPGTPCVELGESVGINGEFLISNDCAADVLLRVGFRLIGDQFNSNGEVLLITGTRGTTQLPPTYTTFETCNSQACQKRTDCRRFMNDLMCPRDLYQTGSPRVQLDLGGNDVYLKPVAVTRPSAPGLDFTYDSSVALHLDVGGADVYLDPTSLYADDASFTSLYGVERPHPTQGSAYGGGVAILFDTSGTDTYTAISRSQGYGRYGFGALIDLAGGDSYEGERFVQGAGSEMLNVGIGLLYDREGSDSYKARTGLGYGLGGVFLDTNGRDTYTVPEKPLGAPAARLDIIPGGNVTTLNERDDERFWLDGPDALNIGLGMDREAGSTSIQDFDTDGDRFPDLLEYIIGSDPKDASDTPQQGAQRRLNAAIDDTDGDGWSDALERALSTDPKNPQSFPASLPRDLPRAGPTQDQNATKAKYGKIIDLRVPLQDAGRIEKACTNYRINGTAPYTPRDAMIDLNSNDGRTPDEKRQGVPGLLNFNSSRENDGLGNVQQPCVQLAYETKGNGEGNGTIPSGTTGGGQGFAYSFPLGILALGDTNETTYDIDYFVAIDMGGRDRFLNAAGGALPVKLGASTQNASFLAPSFAMSIDSEGDLGRDEYAPPGAKPQSYNYAQGSLLGILIDTRGNDLYQAGNASQGSMGGVLLDLGGADKYVARDISQGASISQRVQDSSYAAGLGDTERVPANDEGLRRHIPGLLADFGSEKDSYTAHAHSQGAARGYPALDCATRCDTRRDLSAHAYGILFDQGGDDRYSATMNSQGVGSDRATGILFDAAGVDSYEAVGIISQGATISRSFGQPSTSATRGDSLGFLADMGGATDTYLYRDATGLHDRTATRQNNVTVSTGSAHPESQGTQLYTDKGVHLDTQQETFAGTLAGTGKVSPTNASADARFLVNMPSARLAIGGVTNTTYTSEYALVVDLGGENTYKYNAAGFIRDLVAGAPVLNSGSQIPEHPVATLYPVTFLFDTGLNASRYVSDKPYSQGSGYFSVGVLVDSGGADSFESLPQKLPGIGSNWPASPILADGNIGTGEWAGITAHELRMPSFKDPRFARNVTLRIANDHENLYLAIEVETTPDNNRSKDVLIVDLDPGHDRDERFVGGLAGIDQVYVKGDCSGGFERDRYYNPLSKRFVSDGFLGNEDKEDVTIGCTRSETGLVYEITKPLRETFPRDVNDTIIRYSDASGLLTTDFGFRIETQESFSGDTFAWPPLTVNVDGALSYPLDGRLHDEMSDWASLRLANLGKHAETPLDTKASGFTQGSGVAGVGVIALMGNAGSNNSLVASHRAQGYGAYGGLGLLFDAGSSDIYRSVEMAQGAADAFGVGVFLDIEGNDNHLAQKNAYGYAVATGSFASFNDAGGYDQYGFIVRNGVETENSFDSKTEGVYPPGNQRVWQQGAGGFGVDGNSQDFGRESLQSTSNVLLDGVDVSLSVRKYDRENLKCTTEEVPSTTGGSVSRLQVNDTVCLVAHATLRGTGAASPSLEIDTIDFMLDGQRLVLPASCDCVSRRDAQFTAVYNATSAEDGISAFQAIAHVRVLDATKADAGVLRKASPERVARIDNAPKLQLSLAPTFEGGADGAFSPFAAQGDRVLNVSWNISHDAAEDRLELYQGWQIPAETRNQPCPDDATKSCAILPLYFHANAGITDTQPGTSLVAGIGRESPGDNSYTTKTELLKTPLVIRQNDAFHLHISGRGVLAPQASITTHVRIGVAPLDHNNIVAMLAEEQFVRTNPPTIDASLAYQLSSARTSIIFPDSDPCRGGTCNAVAPPAREEANWSDFRLDVNLSRLAGVSPSIVAVENDQIRIAPGYRLVYNFSLVSGAGDGPITTAYIEAGDPNNNQHSLRGLERQLGLTSGAFFRYDSPATPSRLEVRIPSEPTTDAKLVIEKVGDPDTTYDLLAQHRVEGDLKDTLVGPDGRRPTERLTPFTGSISTSALPDGMYTLRLYATDVGGQAVNTSRTFLLDSTYPTTTITTPAQIGTALLDGRSIPVTWTVTETGESASGLNRTHLFAKASTESDWKFVGTYPEGVRRATYEPDKQKGLSFDFLTIGEDKVGNLERTRPVGNEVANVTTALASKAALGAGAGGYSSVRLDEAIPIVSSPRIDGGRPLSYKGNDIDFVRAGTPVSFSVDAVDNEGGTGIGRVDVVFVYVNATTGAILSHERNLCDGGCSASTFTYNAWHTENTDKANFPDGVWGVIFEVYDAGSNIVRVNLGNVLLDSVAPTATLQPTVYPPDQTAASRNDRVSVRLLAYDEFGVDNKAMTLDTSAVSTEGVVSFRPLRVEGIIYQETSFAIDKPTIATGVYQLPLTIADNAGNAKTYLAEVAVHLDETDIVAGTLRLVETKHNSFTVAWNTTAPTNAYVKYGTGLLRSKTPTTTDYTTTHVVTVTGVDPSTGYQFRAVSATPGGYSVESDTLTATTTTALYLKPISPAAGAAVSGLVPVRFEGGVLDTDSFVSYTLEARRAGANWSFVTTTTQRGTDHTLGFNSSRYLDGAAYELRLTAEAGHEKISATFGPFTSDNTLPTVSIISPRTATNETTPLIRAEVRDALSGFETNAITLLIDNVTKLGVESRPIQGEENALSVSYRVASALAPGNHRLELRAVDAAGNKWVEKWDVIIDGDAPRVSVNTPTYAPGISAAKLGGQATLNLTVTDTGGIRSVIADTSEVSSQTTTLLFRVIGTDRFVGTFPVTATAATATPRIPVTATDLAGNEVTILAPLAIDNVAPEAGEPSAKAATHTSATIGVVVDEPVILEAIATAPRSPDVKAATTKLDDKPTLVFTGLLPSRVYTYTLTILDGAGNAVTRQGTFDTKQDTEKPSDVRGLVVTDLLNGTLRLTWSAAKDDIGVAKYRVYRSDDGGVNYAPIAEVADTIYEDHGLAYEATRLYRVVAVDYGNNEGQLQDPVRASATALPRLESGLVSPTVGSSSTTFKYTIRYVSPGGVAPTYVRIIIDGVAQEMTRVGDADYVNGALYEHATRLAPHKVGEPHTYAFEASDGRYTVSFVEDGEPLRGPLVSGDANAARDTAGLANFAQQVPLGGTVGALAGIFVAALVVALIVRKKKEGSK